MPLLSSLFIALLFLAPFGGLLLLLLRRSRGGLFFSPCPAEAPRFCSAMQAPDVTARPRVKISAGGRSSSGTPFPPTAQGELLLVVDDEASVCELLSTVLTNHGYQVETARNGLEGAKYYAVHQKRVALVISDMHMPQSDGKSFADLLRAIRPDTKILFMSGMDNAQVSNPPLSHDPFLLKPFKPAALLETIHRLLHPEDTLKG
jgi:CheY-like chemotaxis protein